MPPLHVHDGQARPCTSSVADPSPPPGGMDRPTQGRRQGTDPQQPHVCPARWKRYGNKYGRFASCQRCNLRLRWSDKQQDWLEDGQGPSRKFSLPAPSSAEILLTSTTSYPKFRPGARALQTPKSLPAPSTSSSSRQPRPTRAPAPSGHRRDGPLPGHDGGGRRDGLHRDLQRRGLGIASRCTIAPGVRKRLTGKVNNALHAITKEYQIYQTNYLYCKSRADIMEAFAGSAKISKMSSAYGLKAVTPLDFNTGVDLSTKHGQDICNSLMDRYHPLFFFAEIDCRPWVLLQDNVNFLHRPHELQSWRDSVRPMVARTASWCLKQHNAGRRFLIENPDNSRLWAEPTIDELRQLTNAFEVKCHHGAYGATNSKGQLIRKTFRFLTNNQHMANALMRKLSPEALQQCVPLEGKEVTLSQEYSDGLVKEMLEAVRRTAQELQPARFAPRRAHQVLANFAYSEPEPDAAAWKPIMEQVKEFFTRTSLKTTLLNPQEILYQDIHLYRGTSTDCSLLLRPSLSDNLDTYLIRIVELSCSTPGMKLLPSSPRTSPRFTFPAGDFPELWMWNLLFRFPQYRSRTDTSSTSRSASSASSRTATRREVPW